jgi:hypothetical protein
MAERVYVALLLLIAAAVAAWFLYCAFVAVGP